VIARALSPAAPERLSYEAAEAAENIRQDLLARGESFCMETVFSDREGSKREFFRKAQTQGYRVVLIFIGLDSVLASIGRVNQRVIEGGHDVPHDRLTDRYPRTLGNLRAAIAFVDAAFVFDNSAAEQPYRLVAKLKSGTVIYRGPYQPKWWLDLLP
jgi:predicted ABC-type ATPase